MFFGKSHSAIKGYPEIYALKYPTIQELLGYSLMQRKQDMSKFHSLFRALPADKKLWVETDGMTEDFDFPHVGGNFSRS